MRLPRILPILMLALTLPCMVVAQQKARVYGKVTNASQRPVQGVTVGVSGLPGGSVTVANGSFSLDVPSDTAITIEFRHVSYKGQSRPVNLRSNEQRQFKIILQKKDVEITTFVLEEEANRAAPMVKIDPQQANVAPTLGGVERLLLTQALGTVSNNELSSQYSVRGGNFDENLVYVNDILIYRPFLVRSGQQEGLSFVNSDLVESVDFSSGGFEARYGDKMSSVLDIQYKKPDTFALSVTGSLLGGAMHVEGASKDTTFSYLGGVRFRSNQYVLNSLNTQGAYQPAFFDFQGYLTYRPNDKFEMNVLGNVSSNRYTFIPETRETDFGTINEALRLTVFFDGQEESAFQTSLGAVNFTYRPFLGLNLKLIGSAFQTNERETFDIEGAYRLDELERDLSQENFGGVAFNRGVGSFLDHARNFLTANVYSLEHKGTLSVFDNTWLWGVRYQHDIIDDELNEWSLVDSSGFSIPQTPNDEIVLQEVIKINNRVETNRLSGYLQHNKRWLKDSTEFVLLGGGRFNYWDFSEQLLFSPRASLSMRPLRWKSDWLFRASWGYYRQPPFYREMRDLFGVVNPNIKAQTSIHYVLGGDHNFEAWGRDFKFRTEIYYKQLQDIIPYELENLRIRYYATNNAKGDAKGIDFNINGEFVAGIDSWVNLSVMQVREDLLDDFYVEYFNEAGEEIIFGFSEDQTVVDSNVVEPGFIPRPTDQRVNFGLYFQDYYPGKEWLKMHLNLLWGSGLPFGPPDFERYKDVLRIPPYRRVDIGFSAQLVGDSRPRPKKTSPFHHFNSLWVSLEVFNLLQVNNTISYLWVRDISNRQYAIPNYLTARQLNLKLIAKF